MEGINQQSLPPFPPYKEIIQEIGKQLRSRKKTTCQKSIKISLANYCFYFAIFFPNNLCSFTAKFR